MIKTIAKDVLEGLVYLHEKCHIIHTDLKPDNVISIIKEQPIKKNPSKYYKKYKKKKFIKKQKKQLLKKNQEKLEEFLFDNKKIQNTNNCPCTKTQKKYRKRKLNKKNVNHLKYLTNIFTDGEYKITDFSNACFFYDRVTDRVQPVAYRAPEVLIGHRYDTSVDIWSFGCMLFELLTNKNLFSPKEGKNILTNKNKKEYELKYSLEEYHLGEIMQVFGVFPKKFALSGRYSKKYFNLHGKLRNRKILKKRSLKDILILNFNYDEKVAEEISEFLLLTFEIDPTKRISARKLLRHPFLKSKNGNNNEEIKKSEFIKYFLKKKEIEYRKNGYESDDELDRKFIWRQVPKKRRRNSFEF